MLTVPFRYWLVPTRASLKQYRLPKHDRSLHIRPCYPQISPMLLVAHPLCWLGFQDGQMCVGISLFILYKKLKYLPELDPVLQHSYCHCN